MPGGFSASSSLHGETPSIYGPNVKVTFNLRDIIFVACTFPVDLRIFNRAVNPRLDRGL